MRKGEKRSLYAGTVTRIEGPKPLEYRGRDEAGQQVRRRFRTLDEVEAFDRKLDGRKTRRKNGLPEERDPISLAALIAIYVEQHQVRPQTLATLRYNLKHAERAFGNTLVTDLRPEEIARWNANLDLAPTTRGHALKALRQVLSAGVEWGYLALNPARASRTVKTPTATRKPIKPFQSWAEVVRVSNAAGKWGPLIRFACATGLREQEWLALRWSDVNTKAAPPRLYVRRTIQDGEIRDGIAKTSNSHRVVLLSDRALAALRDVPRALNPGQLIFPGESGTVLDVRAWSRRGDKAGKRQGPWRRALASAGLDYRAPGQMRHTYATLAISQWHAPIQTVSKQLGHGDIKVTLDHYAGYLATADEHYLALLNAPEPDDVSEMCQPDSQAAES